MRSFKHESAASFAQAGELLKATEKAAVIAGGTDLIGGLKTAILPDEDAPGTLIDIKTVADAQYIRIQNDSIKIGALTKLASVAESAELIGELPILSQAAKSVATPVIRNAATIGGNICQDVRCWYYRYPHEVGDRFLCSRKGGNICYAVQGENRYHSVFGGMKTHADPCTKGCPAGTDIPAYMAKIREDDWDGAAEIIMRVNPMPMLTSRVCPHPCQDNCNQSEYGDCVGIHCVERTLGDYILKNADKFYRKPENETGKKAAIVGAGPGGLTAAYFLRRQGHDVTVIDSHEKPGGVLYYGIPHYRLPKHIVEQLCGAIEKMGVKFKMNTTVGKDVSLESMIDGFDSVYFGTGAWKQPILGIQGEALTQFGLNFLVEVNTFLKKAIDDDVLVCGGGNVAMDVALTAKRMGAKNVRLVCLEQEKEMPATAEEIARAKDEGVTIHNGWGLKGVVTENGKATGLEAKKCLSVFDENGRFAPIYDEAELKVFDASAIILATGQRVDTAFLGGLSEQLTTPRGLIDADSETFQTKNEKIFAGGDVVTGPNIAIRAIHAGGSAAKAMSRKLGFPIAQPAAEKGNLTFDVEGVKQTKGAALPELPIEKRTLTDEDCASLDMEQAKAEAGRCMNCGCYSVNASDISPVLVALDADIVTNKKTVPAERFFTTKLSAADMLDADEIVTEISIPKQEGYRSGYKKLRVRDAVDFAIVSLAYAYKLENGKIADIRLVFGGVAPVPRRAFALEEYLTGKAVSEQVIGDAAELAVAGASPMDRNTFKLQEMKAAIKAVLEEM